MWIFPLLLLIAFEAVADIFSKEYSLHGKLLSWMIAISSYLVANVFWLMAIRRGSGLTRGAILFSIGSAFAAILIGTVLYNEKLTPTEWFGVLFGVIAIGLLA